MLNLDDLIPGMTRELIGIVETGKTVTKFYKQKRDGRFSVIIMKTTDIIKLPFDFITVDEDHFNDFVDGLIDVLQTIEKDVQNELN